MLLLDIDHSLLFDEAAMKKIAVPTLLVERVGEEKRFMTMRTHLRLKRLVEKNGLIPFTSRTFEAFRQLELFQIDAKPKWAILESGRILLKDGKPDKRYENWLRQHDEEASLETVLRYLEEVEQLSWTVYPSEAWAERIRRPHQTIRREEDEAKMLDDVFKQMKF
ncbi:hypothetical protein ABIC15_000303 [Exiguobacterium sp. PvP048]|uniref:FCP1 homology domain-containing protein n=1 Tax=Exiguobacterium sibiricum (strain DSM 17290 / CCUG 55495 / CIP 109462 / JCM 13490 / 255-15) TaxID=262543 RepID=B1YJA4_EXIS2|nr:hypothetical protein [Exiguobacterium sibiricum]ACB61485.1 hypothetical protein Exig_2033 [Exiguobacterium sibiricum 255-15]